MTEEENYDYNKLKEKMIRIGVDDLGLNSMISIAFGFEKNNESTPEVIPPEKIKIVDLPDYSTVCPR